MKVFDHDLGIELDIGEISEEDATPKHAIIESRKSYALVKHYIRAREANDKSRDVKITLLTYAITAGWLALGWLAGMVLT